MPQAEVKAMSLDKETIRAKIDVESLYNELLGYSPAARDGKNLTFRCPWHADEKNPNLKVNIEPGKHRGSFKCFACDSPDTKGDVFAFVMKQRGVKFPEALSMLAERAGLPVTQEPKEKQQASCILALNSDKWPDHLLTWLQQRGLTTKTAERFGCAYALYIGKVHGFAIPVGNPKGDGFWKIRLYQKNEPSEKFARWPRDRKSVLYHNAMIYEERLTLICAGELDALRTSQESFSVISGTLGEGSFRPEWAETLKGRDAAIIYDLDKTGEKGPEKVASILEGIARSVKVVKLPEDLGEKGDLTDFFQSGRTAQDLRELIETTPNYSPQQQKSTASPIQSVSLSEVQETVVGAFGETASFVVRCCLSVCATLLIEDVVNPTGLNLVGPPSSLKTTILGMFYGNKELVYVSDQFTPAAFVTLASGIKKSKLEEIDLLPKIQHKTLIVPELAPLFQKRKDDLLESFSMLTRVFDGEGLQRDGGTGSRGYSGDYLFAWLGATTPLDHNVWKLMGRLGSRFLFLTMPDTLSPDDKKARIMKSLRSTNTYKERRQLCREVVNNFLAGLWEQSGGVRGIKWDNAATDEKILSWITDMGRMVSLARSTVSVWREKYEGGDYSFTQPTIEGPDRLSTILFNLARGHALINGRTHLTFEDLTPIIEIGLSSMPDDRRQVIQLLLDSSAGFITSSEIEQKLSVSRPTARAIMKILAVLGIGNQEEGVGQSPHTLTLAEEFQWARSEEFRSLRASEVWSWIPF